MVAYRPLTYSAGYQEDESLRRAHEALSGGIQSEGQVVNLLVPDDRADIGAFCLYCRRVCLHAHYFLHISRLQCDVEGGNRVDLNRHSTLNRSLEAGGLHRNVISPDSYVRNAIDAFASRCRVVRVSGRGVPDGHGCTADRRARAIYN